jgi:hypothetical protein
MIAGYITHGTPGDDVPADAFLPSRFTT